MNSGVQWNIYYQILNIITYCLTIFSKQKQNGIIAGNYKFVPNDSILWFVTHIL